MLELTYSNRTEALLDRFVERVQAERAAGRGPWEAIHVVVPSPYFKEYLTQGLARRLGVAANLRFSYLDGLWQELLVDERHSLLAFAQLRAGLLGVLGDPGFLAAPELKPVRDYLGGDNLHLKRVQLAAELGKVFEEYQLSRPDWLALWRAGKRVDPLDPMEAWQAKLWLEALRVLDGAAPAGQGVEHLTLLELVGRSSFSALRMPRALHGFGLTHVAQAYQEVFRAFGALPGTTLHIYALNPCAEFWEDLDTDRRALARQLPTREAERRAGQDEAVEDLYGLASAGPMALRLWGRPGREKIRLLNEVSECDFTPVFRMPDESSILGRMQRDILLFQEPADDERGAPDPSIRCLACPSPRREAEVVATDIWKLLERHRGSAEPLRFSDIAVVVPPGQEAAYQAHLQAAFQHTRAIPMVQSDLARPILRQTLEAVDLLLALPSSGLTRSAMLALLGHPALQRNFGDLDGSAWGRWCATLGIVRGADQAAWSGTYLEQDALNWDQGIKRLALGSFMSEGLELRTETDAYRVNGAKDHAAIAAFSALVRGLCEDAESLAAAKDDPRVWCLRLASYLEKWLQVEEGEEAEAVLRALARVREALEGAFERVPAGLTLPAIDFAAARQLAAESLERLKSSQPVNLAKGVVVSTYATMRALPFRAIYLMGLGEGCFPSRSHQSALDLRKKGRRAGDVSQTEKDKYLFLELLLSAREHLTLSYVAMDELSGDSCEPSGLYKEFRTLLDGYLNPGLASGGDRDPILEQHPLHRFDPAYFPGWFPGTSGAALTSYSEIAEREARAALLGEQARAWGFRMPLALADLALPPAQAAGLRLALDSPAITGAERKLGPLHVSLAQLKTFLECPLSGAAAVRLGLQRRELDDRAALEDESFASDALEAWGIRQQVTLEVLRTGQEPAQVYARHLTRLQDGGTAPFGVFAEVEREANLPIIEAWVQHLRAASPGLAPSSWRLGPARSGQAAVERALPPLAVDVPVGDALLRVELTGDLRVQLDGTLILERGQVPAASGLDRLRQKALGAYLDHLVLACVDPAHAGHQARFVFTEPKKGANPPQEFRLPFAPVTAAAATRQLAAWLQDLLSGDHAVLFPIEAVLALWPDQLTEAGIQAFVEAELEKEERSFLGTLRGPVPDPGRFPPAPEPRALAEARLGGFLAAVGKGDPAEAR